MVEWTEQDEQGEPEIKDLTEGTYRVRNGYVVKTERKKSGTFIVEVVKVPSKD